MRSLLLSVVATSALATDHIEVEIPGATIAVRFAGAIDAHKANELVEWIRATANHVNLVYGRFPNPAPAVVVIPARRSPWGDDSPVPFGRVTRRGTETVELHVDIERPVADLYGDWTATHEFSHLLLPRLSWRQRWIAEGFASYYQNVLMARSGRYTEQYALQRLHDGLERGRQSRPELSPNGAAARGLREARMKIYWSGAALALIADVELRRRSAGRDSLDTALGRLQACCLPSSRRWSGPQLFGRLDALLDVPVFMPLYEHHADTSGFPDTAALMRDLGVTVQNGRVELRDDARLAAIRRNIFGVRTSTD